MADDVTIPTRRIKMMRRLMKIIGDVLFMKTTLKITVRGVENVPLTGPALVLINHVSNFDPLVTISSCRVRDVVPVSKIEFYETFWGRIIIDNFGAIPINRGEMDREALKRSLALLRGPDMLMLAPEGTRHANGLSEPKEGVAFLASKANAMMVPTGVSGTRLVSHYWHRLRRAPITVHYGKPVHLRAGLKRDQYGLVMQELMYQIAPLLTEDLRGDYKDLSKATMTTLEYV